MRCIAITGASGFVGRHLLASLSGRHDLTVHALAHRTADESLPRGERLHWFRGDIADPHALGLLAPDATLVNLAYPAGWSRAQHLQSTAALAQAAATRGVRRVIHCSTAVVAGDTTAEVVTEATPVQPQTRYEGIKLAIEDLWRKHAKGNFELVVLRPTAVFGPHGKNLLKLADALTAGTGILNYLRSSLSGHRQMNLISVQNVVAALELLIDHRSPLASTTFLASEDDEPGNNFRDVETALMKAFAIPDYVVRPLPLPRKVTRSCLRIAGSSKSDPFRKYDNSLLLRAGWIRRCTLTEGIAAFAAWYCAARAPARRQ